MKKDILRVFMTNVIKVSTVFLASFFIPAMLSVEEYAIYKYFSLIASYIGILHFGFCDGIFLEYGGRCLQDVSENKLASEQKSIYFFEVIISTLIIISGVLKRDIVIVIVGLNVLPSILITYYAMMYQSMGEFKLYAIIYNGLSVLTLISNAVLIFIVRVDNGIMFASATVVVNFITALYTTIYFNKKYIQCKGRVALSILTKYMRMGILLTIGNTAYILFSSVDKWFVKWLLDTDEFAYYSFAVQLLSVMNMFINPVGLTLYSYLSRRKEKEFEYNIKIIITTLLFFMLTGVFVIKFVIEHFLVKYTNSISLIIILFLAQVFLLLNSTIYINMFKTYRMQKQYFFNLVISVVVSAMLNATFFYIGNRTSKDIALATLVGMIIWAMLNLRHFKYLQYTRNHFLFIGCMTLAYVFLNVIGKNIINMIFYLLIWLIILNIFANDVSKQYAQWVRSGFSIIREKFIR